MDVEVLDIESCHPDLKFIRSSLFWRGDSEDITTDLIKSIPFNFLSSVIRNGGISAAICFAVVRLYPQAVVGKFRSSETFKMKFTVEQGRHLLDDITNGAANENIGKFLKNLKTCLSDDYYKIYEVNQSLRFILSRPRDSAGTSNPEQTDEHLPPKQTEDPTPNPEDTISSFEWDMLNGLMEDDANSLWKERNYKAALPFFKKCEKTVKGQDRPIFLLKFSICLRQCDELDGSLKRFSEALQILKENPTFGQGYNVNLAESIRQVGDRFIECSSPSRAVWVFNSAAELFSRSNNISGSAIGILNCMTGLQKMDQSNLNNQLQDLIVQSQLRHMRNIEKLSVHKNECEPWMLATAYTKVADWYSNSGMGDEKASYLRKVLEVMENAYGEKARERATYGISTHNLGVEILRIRRFSEAEDLFSKAIIRQEAAKDWESEKRKQKCIGNSRRLLQQATLKHGI